ncbi:MAG: hypothetical protein U9Q73_02425 [Nanoarchaeota archaeon]|nr:hypothetical protein [Nanoarchaeota archaeon]
MDIECMSRGNVGKVEDSSVELASKIEALSPAERRALYNLFIENLYDRDWCLENKENYGDPNIERVKEKTYYEMVRSGLVEVKQGTRNRS